jgi:hypothetical protein
MWKVDPNINTRIAIQDREKWVWKKNIGVRLIKV